MTETQEARRTVGQLYHDQLAREYIQAGEQLARNAMVMLCLEARDYNERAKFVVLDDSDQGEWQYVVGLASALPMLPGDYADGMSLDDEYGFDDGDWSSSLDDRTRHVWEQFVVASPSMQRWQFLDVDKVLAEVSLPWREVPARSPWSDVTGFKDMPAGFHDSKRERDANTVSEPKGESTWTFVGHWENDRIVVEYVLSGEVLDVRDDMGYWEQGLWAAAGSGATVEQAQASAVAEYEAEYNDDEADM